MEINKELMDRLLFNARISLGEEEKEEIMRDLEEILTAFKYIDELGLENVQPAIHPIEVANILRRDEPREFSDRELLFINLDTNNEGFLWGPKTRKSQK